jgi:predicted ester cyclase
VTTHSTAYRASRGGRILGSRLLVAAETTEETAMNLTKEDAQAIVAPFYRHALTVNAETTSTAVLEKILADGFESVNGQETKTKAVLVKQVEYFWKLIPDLKWEPADMVIGGNKVVVRSVASGSPRGNFMGLELDGTKSFRIDTIDIHEIENGRIVRVHHLEDWGTAIKQLRG